MEAARLARHSRVLKKHPAHEQHRCPRTRPEPGRKANPSLSRGLLSGRVCFPGADQHRRLLKRLFQQPVRQVALLRDSGPSPSRVSGAKAATPSRWGRSSPVPFSCRFSEFAAPSGQCSAAMTRCGAVPRRQGSNSSAAHDYGREGGPRAPATCGVPAETRGDAADASGRYEAFLKQSVPLFLSPRRAASGSGARASDDRRRRMGSCLGREPLLL